jgi:hypothetical protein
VVELHVASPELFVASCPLPWPCPSPLALPRRVARGSSGSGRRFPRRAMKPRAESPGDAARPPPQSAARGLQIFGVGWESPFPTCR